MSRPASETIECGHCGNQFAGTYRQTLRARAKDTVYCSAVCRNQALSKKAKQQALNEGRSLRNVVLAGPCKTCGNMFESKTSKMFCTMNCYIKSEQFQEMSADNRKKAESSESIARRAQAAKLGQDALCLECGEGFYQKRATKTRPAKKYCNSSCYRSYLAKRFDRYIANPEGVELPQCYDEFLDKENLACPVDGCDWHGQFLGLHINLAHGIQSKDFKRAAGFNISTGLVGKYLAQKMRETSSEKGVPASFMSQLGAVNHPRNSPVSLEAREHKRKARALEGPGPQRCCKGCGATFQQRHLSGRALFCSLQCRESHYQKMRKKA